VNVVPIQVFVSLLLVAGSVVLFVFTARQRDFDHADRLSLAPLEDDAPAAVPKETTPACKPSASPTTTP
jgi:hypothetical protein